jgi:SAM-dependent methyltransferase
MALSFHGNVAVMLDQQYQTTRNFIIPFIEKFHPITEQTRVMDIGCGFGGVLRAFLERGCSCLGVDLNTYSIEQAQREQAQWVATGQARFEAIDIYKFEEMPELFDIIIFKDSIEHIPEQARIIKYVKRFLKPDGKVFFGFPPWPMPFGGHQQLMRNKFWSRIPWYHLLPKFLYRPILKMAGESPEMIAELLEIKDLGLYTHTFERYVRQGGYKILERKIFLTNPIYAYKFNIKPRTQPKMLGAIPIVRDFVSTCVYYLITPDSKTI